MKPKPEKMPRGSGRQFTARKAEHSGQMWALGSGLGLRHVCREGGWENEAQKLLPQDNPSLWPWAPAFPEPGESEQGSGWGTAGLVNPGFSRQRRARWEVWKEAKPRKGGGWREAT